MNIKQIFIFNIISLVIYQCKDNEIDIRIFKEIKNSISISSFEEYQEVLSSSDVTYLNYYYKKNDKLSKLGAYFLYSLQDKLDFIGKIIMIDCDYPHLNKKYKECSEKEKDGSLLIPRIKILVPSNKKYNKDSSEINIHKEFLYKEKSVSSDLLFNSFVSNLVTHFELVDIENYQSFIKRKIYNKIIIFLDSLNNNNEYENYLKGLSNIYYDRVLIGVSRDKELIDKLNISKFPFVIGYNNTYFINMSPIEEKYEISSVSQNQNASSLIKSQIIQINNTINKYSSAEKLYMRRLFEFSFEKIRVFSLTSTNFYDFFRKFKNLNKIILFSNKIANNLSILDDLINKLNGILVFSSIDCLLYKSICNDFFNVNTTKQKDFIVKLYSDENDIYTSLHESKIIEHLKVEDIFQLIRKKQTFSIRNFTNMTLDELYKEIYISRNDENFICLFLYNNETIENNYDSSVIFDVFSLSNEYSNFIYMKIMNPEERIIKKLKVKSFPAQILIYHNKIDDENFQFKTNYNITYMNMRKFIESSLSLNYIKNHTLNYEKSKIIELDDYFYLLTKCIYSEKPCFLTFLNGEYSNISIKNKKINGINPSYYKYYSLLNNQTNSYENFDIFIVNATCHIELMKSFKLQFIDLPSIIYYNGNKEVMAKRKFETVDDINDFLNTINNMNDFIHLPKNKVNINRIDCYSITKQRDLSKIFDYGGRENEEIDNENIFNEDDIGDNISSEFYKKYLIEYEKFNSQLKKKNDL